MTEVERIINKGILPQNFLKEEYRSDFFVDSLRKKMGSRIRFDIKV